MTKTMDSTPKRFCVIGGSRYFGRRVVDLLLESGADVTVVNRGSTTPPPGARHVVADRDAGAALAAALGDLAFDAVIDQVCYRPEQAETAVRVFAGRTSRYVMTSTIEVYDTGAADDYGRDKLAAERVFEAAGASGAFAFAAVRSGHVLGGGTAEFTGRLQHYVDAIRADEPIAVHEQNHPTSFIEPETIASVLVWAAWHNFTGPIDAATAPNLDVRQFAGLVGEALGRTPRFRTVAPGETVSPFAMDRAYAMDNGRAVDLGFAFPATTDWLPRAVTEAL